MTISATVLAAAPKSSKGVTPKQGIASFAASLLQGPQTIEVEEAPKMAQQNGFHTPGPIKGPCCSKKLIKGGHLSLQDIVNISRSNRHVSLSHDVDAQLSAAHQLVLDGLNAGQAIYGVNTNFGGLATEQLTADEASALQENLIWGHKSGAGGTLPPQHVRAAMLIRANALAKGASGVRRVLIERLLAFLNGHVTPVVRELGSIGASGDLIPLSQVAGCIVGLGDSYRAVDRDGRELDALTALAEMGLAPLKLQAKEGLALINGTSMMTGIACHVITEAQKLLRLALYLHAFYIQALAGSPEPFSAFIHQCKPHPGQVEAARVMRELLKGGTCLPSTDQMIGSGNGVIQDRYSIRCLPQFMGPTLDAIALLAKQVEVEANSVDDNPLLDISTGHVLHGGNFQGQYIGTGMDQLRYHIALLTKHLDTQIAMLVTPGMNNGLPASLVGTRDNGPGIKLGLKALQICNNSILPRLMHLAAPVAHLFPTHAEQYNQNINSQGFNSANLAWESIRLLRIYLSAGLIFAIQSVELRAFVREGHYDGEAYLSPACRPLYKAFYGTVGQQKPATKPLVEKNGDQDFGDLISRLETDLASVDSKLMGSIQEV